MRTSKQSWVMVTMFSVGIIGVVAGGPRTMTQDNQSDFSGALVQDCNGNETNNNPCPKEVGLTKCNEGSYYTIRDELPGTLLTKRYNNDTRVCTAKDDDCKKYTLKEFISSGSEPNCKRVLSKAPGGGN